MSLEVNIGKRGNILEVGPENADQVSLISFKLSILLDIY
jgi:glutamate synthase (ferredoxin)